MDEISAQVTRGVLGMCDKAGIPVGGLIAGLGFDARSIRRVKRVQWDDHCALIERLAAALGGADKLETMVAESFHSALAPELQAVFGATLGPKLLYRFFFATMVPTLFPGHDMEVRELPDGRLRISARLVNNARSSLTR